MRLELYRSIIEHILSQVWTDTIVRFKLNHRKTFLCISNCLLEQPDTWASNQGAMIESIFKTSCEIIESGWDKDRAPVDTFIMGLASSIRERNDYEEQVTFQPFSYRGENHFNLPAVHPPSLGFFFILPFH